MNNIIKIELYNFKKICEDSISILYKPRKIKCIMKSIYHFNLYKILYKYIINNNIQSFKKINNYNDYYEYNLINYDKRKHLNIKPGVFNLVNICNHRPELIESLLIEI